MSERLGFALVVLVAVASIASLLLFLTGNTPTGLLSAPIISCEHVSCPGHEDAYPLLDNEGHLIYNGKTNTFVCACP